jgi:hypothetical protein
MLPATISNSRWSAPTTPTRTSQAPSRGQDHINLDYDGAAFDPNNASSFNAWLASHATDINGHDVMIDLNVDGNHSNVDTLLLKNVQLASLHASDFIVS